MQLKVHAIDEFLARDILNWRYEAPYDFYNNEFSLEAFQELLNQSYFAIVDTKGNLIGFFCTGALAQVPLSNHSSVYPLGYLDVGIGMNPAFTGQGRGAVFFSFILNFIKKQHRATSLRLTVAAFNTRAIRLYEKLGFKKEMGFVEGDIEFMTMIKREP